MSDGHAGVIATRRASRIFAQSDFLPLESAHVESILKGAKVGDVPTEQPKTANALSLTIPPSLLPRADQAIE